MPPVPTKARLAAALGGRLPQRGAKIGLLGGSFNPAHEGHLTISSEALKRLGLDEVWWLVSPQNPLKPVAGMAPFDQRLASARKVARHPKFRPTGIEKLLGTRFTADTLKALKRRFPGVKFVWLMGADNLLQIDRWEAWQEIFHLQPVAALARPTYSSSASSAKAARRFHRFRCPDQAARTVALKAPPAWVFLHTKLDRQSATRIRAQGGLGTRKEEKRQ